MLARFAHVEEREVAGPGIPLPECCGELLDGDEGADPGADLGRGGGPVDVGVRGERHGLPGSGAHVVDEDGADERRAVAEDELDHLGGHRDAESAGHHAEHAALRAGRHAARRGDVGVEVAVDGAASGVEHAELPARAEHRAPHVRDPEDGGGVGHEVAGLEVVGAVEHDVVAVQHVEHGVPAQALTVGGDGDLGVESGERAGGGIDLGPADVGGAVDDLPVEVAQVDGVVVDDAERADPRAGEVEGRRGTEAARPDAQDAGGPQALLAIGPDAGDGDLPVVAPGAGCWAGARVLVRAGR